MQPALGSTIKGYRLRRGLSQTELSVAMGWNANPAPISRYDQGRIVPSRPTLERLCLVLELAPDERGFVLMQAGYLPTDEEVDRVLRELQPFLDAWRGPAYLVDFAWRFLGWNQAIMALFGFPPEEVARLPYEKPTLLDFAFDPRWAPRRHLPQEMVVPFGRGQITRFKATHREHTDQRWYRQLLQRLLGIPLFRELWYTTPADVVSELTYYDRVQMDTPSGCVDFHIFASPLVVDPRLFTILWVPANEALARLLP